MNRFLLLLGLLFSGLLTSQNLKTPSEFLGYELGTEFTRHHEVLDYFEYLAETEADRVKLVSYGKTNERRKLVLAYVSSSENIKNLESIREEHLRALNGEGNPTTAIVWLSYNVHGNEAVSTEASMKTLHALLTSKRSYLENTIVIIDPCVNPDGRDRYSNWYNQYKNTPHNVDPNSKEHHEGWWSGRSNHYMFDLNRDWAWLTQIESQQRLKVYNKWMPHVHVDFHEQGVNSPYYFAPAAEPYHEVITKFQRDFQETIGRNHAKYFDKNGWFYFTKEVFDLFYPSYGDTYPTYNGSIGMTYEQGGSGRAGLGIVTQIGDTLTLNDRIAHHYTTGLSTVEVAHKNVEKLNTEFKKFFQNKNYKYKSYALKGNSGNLDALRQLLADHEIEYSHGKPSTVKGFNYNSGTQGSMRIDEKTLIVSTDQPKGTMVKVLFEPDAKLSDSLTYDITAWQLPYAYGLDALATTTLLPKGDSKVEDNGKSTSISESYAYVTDWNSMNDARFLADLFKQKVKVRTAYHPFTLEGKSHERGSLIITKTDNAHLTNLTKTLQTISSKHSKSLTPVSTGFVDSGKDFGSGYVQMIKPPKIAVFSGEPTSTLRFGEVWHFFEQQLHYPVTVLDSDYFNQIDLAEYDVLILSGGRYGNYFDENEIGELKSWVRSGGNLIAMGGAIKAIDGEEGFGLKTKKSEDDDKENRPMPHENGQRERMKNAITGAIFKVKVDNTHPLAYGYGNDYFTLKLGSDAYGYLDSGNAVYFESNTEPVSGFAGSDAKKKLGKTLVFGSDSYGRGNVMYFVDNPLFRGFWENGKLFFANALFMVN